VANLSRIRGLVEKSAFIINFGVSTESKEDVRVCNLFINSTLLPQGYWCDKQGCMAFTEDDLKALRLLLREELQAEVRPFRNEIGRRFDEVATQMDGLYQRDEKREQEYLSIREQIRRLEARFA
jgi:hypothetical protein